MVGGAIFPVRPFRSWNVYLYGQTIEFQILGDDKEAYRFRLQEGMENHSRQAVAFPFDQLAQLLEDEDMIGHDAFSRVALEQGLERTLSQTVSVPRVWNQVQKVIGCNSEKSSTPG